MIILMDSLAFLLCTMYTFIQLPGSTLIIPGQTATPGNWNPGQYVLTSLDRKDLGRSPDWRNFPRWHPPVLARSATRQPEMLARMCGKETWIEKSRRVGPTPSCHYSRGSYGDRSLRFSAPTAPVTLEDLRIRFIMNQGVRGWWEPNC